MESQKLLDGKTGLLVEPDAPEELAEALIFLYRNPERRIEMGQGRQGESQGSLLANGRRRPFPPGNLLPKGCTLRVNSSVVSQLTGTLRASET